MQPTPTSWCPNLDLFCIGGVGPARASAEVIASVRNATVTGHTGDSKNVLIFNFAVDVYPKTFIRIRANVFSLNYSGVVAHRAVCEVGTISKPRKERIRHLLANVQSVSQFRDGRAGYEYRNWSSNQRCWRLSIVSHPYLDNERLTDCCGLLEVESAYSYPSSLVRPILFNRSIQTSPTLPQSLFEPSLVLRICRRQSLLYVLSSLNHFLRVVGTSNDLVRTHDGCQGDYQGSECNNAIAVFGCFCGSPPSLANPRLLRWFGFLSYGGARCAWLLGLAYLQASFIGQDGRLTDILIGLGLRLFGVFFYHFGEMVAAFTPNRKRCRRLWNRREPVSMARSGTWRRGASRPLRSAPFPSDRRAQAARGSDRPSFLRRSSRG